MRRRDFLRSLAAGAAALVAPAVLAGEAARRLDIVSRTLDINGKAAKVFGLTQPDGTQGLILDAASGFNLRLANRLDQATLIHWHGLTPPWPMDGVPDNPKPMLQPGEKRAYSFPLARGGTNWMHAHTLQEQNLLAARLIIHTSEDRTRDEQEIVILLHDFSFTPAPQLLATLIGKPTSGGMDMSGMDMSGMSMSGTDLNDIDYDAYLANDRTLADPQIVRVEKRGRVRLRIINGATGTAFTITTGKPIGTLVAVDGHPVEPLNGHMFPIAMGQRIDVVVDLPSGGGSFPILALREGGRERGGIVLATAGAAIGKLPVRGATRGAVVGLDVERLLRARFPLVPKPADRRFALKLTGSMAPYSWAMVSDRPLRVKSGERVEIVLENASMMTHPIHLHGHSFQVVAINGTSIKGAVRDTVIVPAMARVTVAFDADNPGHWPLHCHHLYHMVTGMMTYVGYEDAG